MDAQKQTLSYHKFMLSTSTNYNNNTTITVTVTITTKKKSPISDQGYVLN